MEAKGFDRKEFQEASAILRMRRGLRIASYVFLGLAAIFLIFGFSFLYGVEIEAPEDPSLGTGIAMAFALMGIYAVALVPIFIGFGSLIVGIPLLLTGLLLHGKKAKGIKAMAHSLSEGKGKEREKSLMKSLRKGDYERFFALSGQGEAPQGK